MSLASNEKGIAKLTRHNLLFRAAKQVDNLQLPHQQVSFTGGKSEADVEVVQVQMK